MFVTRILTEISKYFSIVIDNSLSVTLDAWQSFFLMGFLVFLCVRKKVLMAHAHKLLR